MDGRVHRGGGGGGGEEGKSRGRRKVEEVRNGEEDTIFEGWFALMCTILSGTLIPRSRYL